MSRRRLGIEVLLVLGVSLGESAAYSVLRIIERLTRAEPLAQQTSSLNTSATPDRPWLDLAFQVANLTFPLVPVALALFLLGGTVGRSAWPGDTERRPGRRMGFDLQRPGFDVGAGFLVAAGIGVPGLAFYLAARELGVNTTVQAANLAENWWTIPVLVLAAVTNGVLEEVIMLGYLFIRLRQIGWAPWVVVTVSAVLRGTYHLYQGFGGFAGNLLMGVAFGLLFLRWKRVGPFVVAHTLLDIVAFIGYALLVTRVGWL